MDINFSKPASSASVIPASLRQRGSLFELLTLLAIGILFFLFVASPKAKKLSERNAEIASLKAESEKLAQQQEKMDKLIKQLDASSSDLAKLDESLPLHPRTTWVYLLIESFVGSSGMTISNLSVNNVEGEIMAGNPALLGQPFAQTRTLKKVNVNLGVTGSFAQFQALLRKLENSGRVIDVTVLEVAGSQDNLLDFRMTLDTYYFTPAAQP